MCNFAIEITKNMMADGMIDFVAPIEDKMQGIIKVIGVGGGGCNAVRNMWNDQISGVTYAVCNTDSQSLSRSPVPVKIMLGESGLGAGANPELGRSEAEANVADIEKLLSDGTKMVFVTAGMGGGTGTGAAPVIAGVAKKMGLLTVGVVTIPFYFEKKKKIIKALKGVDELRKNVDALLIVNNERLCDVYADSDLSVKEAFQRADNILMDAVRGISELITMPSDGGIKSDFRDVETTMKNGGGAIMAMGRASGDHRVERAILDALDSPLLYGNDIGKAKRILFNIYASDEHPIFVRELQEIDDFFDQLDPNIDVIWGTATDDSLGEDAKVTILATGLEDELRSEVEQDSHHNTDDFYEDLIPLLYKPVEKRISDVIAQDQELPFEVEPATEMESATEQKSVVADEELEEEEILPEETVGQDEADEKTDYAVPRQAKIVDKWKGWLNDLMKDVTE
ncbi:MAG: cell division protein FtsZ [Prevotella sp.]|nr:cell division protein FtsZ [Prevotella sp.]